MTLDEWLDAALADAARRGLPELKPLLEGMMRATSILRNADLGRDEDARQDPAQE